MKRQALVLLLLFAAAPCLAQTKVGHINSEAIMQTLPEAIDARNRWIPCRPVGGRAAETADRMEAQVRRL